MKQLRFFLLIAFASTIAYSILTSQHLTVDEINQIFDDVNRDGDSTLENQEISSALSRAVKLLFAKAKLYEDQALMEELAKEYAKDCRSTLNRDDFKVVVDHLPRFATTFREKTYIDILRSFEMNEILQDQDLLEEVLKRPDVYGVTYSSYKDTFGELTKVYQEALDSIHRIQRKFEQILDNAKEDPNLKGSEGKAPQEHSGLHLGDEIREGRDRAAAHLDQIGDHIRDDAHHAGETVSNIAQKTQDKIENAADSFKEGLQKLKQTLNSIGGRINKNPSNNRDAVTDTLNNARNQAESTVDDVAHRVHNQADRLEAQSSHVAHEVRDQADDLREKIHHSNEDLRASASHIGDKLKDGIDAVAEGVHHAGDRIRLEASYIGDNLQQGIDRTQDKLHHEAEDLKVHVSHAQAEVKDKAEYVGRDIHDTADVIRLNAGYIADDIGEKADHVKEKVHHDAEDLRASAIHVGEGIRDRVEQTADGLHRTADDVRLGAAHAVNNLHERVHDEHERLHHINNDLRDRASHIGHEIKEGAQDKIEGLHQATDNVRFKISSEVDDLRERANAVREELHHNHHTSANLDGISHVGDDIRAGVDNIHDKAHSRVEDLRASADHLLEGVHSRIHEAADKIHQTTDDVRRAGGYHSDQVDSGDTYLGDNLRENLRDVVDNSGHRIHLDNTHLGGIQSSDHIQEKAKEIQERLIQEADDLAARATITGEDAKYKLDQAIGGLSYGDDILAKAGQIGDEVRHTYENLQTNLEDLAARAAYLAEEARHDAIDSLGEIGDGIRTRLNTANEDISHRTNHSEPLKGGLEELRGPAEQIGQRIREAIYQASDNIARGIDNIKESFVETQTGDNVHDKATSHYESHVSTDPENSRRHQQTVTDEL